MDFINHVDERVGKSNNIKHHAVCWSYCCKETQSQACSGVRIDIHIFPLFTALINLINSQCWYGLKYPFIPLQWVVFTSVLCMQSIFINMRGFKFYEILTFLNELVYTVTSMVTTEYPFCFNLTFPIMMIKGSCWILEIDSQWIFGNL